MAYTFVRKTDNVDDVMAQDVNELQAAIENISSGASGGWMEVTGWSYASASTITVPTGAASIYAVGDQMRLKQGGAYKYFSVVAVADTLLTVTGGSNYSVENAAITDAAFSKGGGVGHPQWFDYVPVWTAATTNPSIGNGILSGRYVQIGKLVYCQFMMIAGSTTTFGSGSWRFGYPVAPNTSYISYQVGSSRLTDAGSRYYSGITSYGGATFMTVIAEGGEIHATAPFTWISGDVLRANVIYEVA